MAVGKIMYKSIGRVLDRWNWNIGLIFLPDYELNLEYLFIIIRRIFNWTLDCSNTPRLHDANAYLIL